MPNSVYLRLQMAGLVKVGRKLLHVRLKARMTNSMSTPLSPLLSPLMRGEPPAGTQSTRLHVQHLPQPTHQLGEVDGGDAAANCIPDVSILQGRMGGHGGCRVWVVVAG